jgi:uncharacterized membrane protein YccC
MRNACWAAMPVWVISQSARGILLERSIFRVAGTLVGAAVGLALVHTPVSPQVQVALLALWIVLNAGVTHILRGVLSYAALLAGMTAAIVVIPSLESPAGAMAIALVRVDCTLIGVVVVGSLVMAPQTPESPLAEFYEEVPTISSKAVSYAVHVLRSIAADQVWNERRILGHISQLEQLARLHAEGSVEGYRRLGDVDLLVLDSLFISSLASAQPKPRRQEGLQGTKKYRSRGCFSSPSSKHALGRLRGKVRHAPVRSPHRRHRFHRWEPPSLAGEGRMRGALPDKESGTCPASLA